MAILQAGAAGVDISWIKKREENIGTHAVPIKYTRCSIWSKKIQTWLPVYNKNYI